MEPRDLRALVACIELGSMTRASGRLHVVQSAVSQAIGRLERECGLPLLERHPVGVRPSEAGQALAAHAHVVINAIDRAEEEMRAFGRLETGTIRLGILHSAIPLILTRLLRALRSVHPGLRLHVEEATASRLTEGVSTGEFDIAVVFLPADLANLQVVELAAADLAVIGAPELQWFPAPEVAMRDLRHEQWVAFPLDNPGRRWLDESCEAAGFAPRIAAEVTTLAQVKDFAAAGVGLGIVPSGAVEPERLAGTLAVAPIAPAVSVSLGYAYRHPQPGLAPTAVRELLDANFASASRQ